MIAIGRSARVAGTIEDSTVARFLRGCGCGLSAYD